MKGKKNIKQQKTVSELKDIYNKLKQEGYLDEWINLYIYITYGVQFDKLY